MSKLTPLPLRDIVIDDPFWSGRIQTAREVSIDYMWRALNDQVPDVVPSHCIRNFRIAAGLEDGAFEGCRFQDSDLYKWLEAVAYSLETAPDPVLLARAEGAIALVAKAQLPNGYIDTYVTLGGLIPWSDTCRAHEMYCAGHMMEAAVAWKSATGSGSLLEIARRFADHIDSVFGPEAGKKKGYPGHQEIELGLFKLYRATGEERYLRLAGFFLDERGRQPFYYDREQRERVDRGEGAIEYFHDHGPMPYSYQQAHLPVREQKEAVGHAVRCVYMCSGMADVGGEADETLLDAARTLYDNIVTTQMYITGGIGSMGDGEAFTFPYDLPNDRMYNETCAAIGMMMLSQRLLNLDGAARYADVLERALYNNVMAGLSLDGTGFFYVNPLEMWPERSLRRHDMKDIVPERQGWYGCACCPPNILRTLMGLGQYIYSRGESALYVNLYIGSTVSFEVGGQRVSLTQRGDYPRDGRISLTVAAGAETPFALCLRLPGWSGAAALSVNGDAVDAPVRDGFLVLERTFQSGDTVLLELPVEARYIYCDDRVPYNTGKVALQRGPLVYCAEEADNGPALWNLSLDTSAPPAEQARPGLLDGVVELTAAGRRRHLTADNLYTTSAPVTEPATIRFIPYYAWGNRGRGEMAVWQRMCTPGD